MQRTPPSQPDANHFFSLRRSRCRSRDTCGRLKELPGWHCLCQPGSVPGKSGLQPATNEGSPQPSGADSPCTKHQCRPLWPRFAAAARAYAVFRGVVPVKAPRTAHVARQHRARRGPIFVRDRSFVVLCVGRYLQNLAPFGTSRFRHWVSVPKILTGRVDHITP